MTFKEMIFKGLCDGTVKIISNPNDDCIACQIGEFWFYFIGSEDEDLTPDEVYESYTKEQLAEMIYSTLQDMEKNEFDEVEYYKEFLAEKYACNKEKSDDMKIESRKHDDGCARGIQILVHDEIVASVDITRPDDEIRIISYKEGIDEPIDITSYNR